LVGVSVGVAVASRVGVATSSVGFKVG
jgi:hypothetical protein